MVTLYLYFGVGPPLGAVLVGSRTPVVELYHSDDILAKVHNEELTGCVSKFTLSVGSIGKSSLLNPI